MSAGVVATFITNYIKAHLGLKQRLARAPNKALPNNKLYQSSSWFETIMEYGTPAGMVE